MPKPADTKEITGPLIYLRPPDLDLAALPAWCRTIAAKVAARYQLDGPSHLDDLASTAHLRALELADEFAPAYPAGYRDPDAAFRGWAHREILTATQREAARLLSGGTIRSPRRGKGRTLTFAKPLSDFERDRSDPALADESLDRASPIPAAPPTKADMSRFPAVAGRLARSFAEFHAHGERIAGKPLRIVARSSGPGQVRVEWADGEVGHRLHLHDDGTFQHELLDAEDVHCEEAD